MASTYDPLNRFELQGDGENNNTWGVKLNATIQQLSEAISGYEIVPTTGGASSLSASNGVSDQSRNAALKFTGVLASNATITIPSASHWYIVWNATTGNFTLSLKTSGGAELVIPQGEKILVICDGTEIYDVISDRKKTGKETIWVPAAAWRPTVSNGCSDVALVELSANTPNLEARFYDGSSGEYAQLGLGFMKSWNEGTITFRDIWLCQTANSLGVAWTLQGVSVGNGVALSSAYGTAVTVIDNNLASANQVLITDESSPITIAGAGENKYTVLRHGRDPANVSDDMTGIDAAHLGTLIYYTTNAANDA